MDLDGSGWIWMDLDGFGWIWMDLDGFGWIWMDSTFHTKVAIIAERDSKFIKKVGVWIDVCVTMFNFT